MPRPVFYEIVDRDDGLFDVIATIEPTLTCVRQGFATLAEADDSIETLRQTMAALGAPVVRAQEPRS